VLELKRVQISGHAAVIWSVLGHLPDDAAFSYRRLYTVATATCLSHPVISMMNSQYLWCELYI